jgi:hypothetical protein
LGLILLVFQQSSIELNEEHRWALLGGQWNKRELLGGTNGREEGKGEGD